jgi:cell division protein FtsA
MAKRSTHTVGLDIGTSRVTCIVAAPGEDGRLSVLGTGESDSRGLRKGVIVNPEAAVESIRRAVEEAERMSGVQAQEVTINLAGSHIMGFNGQAIVAVASREHEITAKMFVARLIPLVRFSSRRDARLWTGCRRNSSSTIRTGSTIRLE